MNISPEDLLKLNVLMAQKPRAVRIDENRMQVFALTENSEAKIDLNPNTMPIPYLRRVREFLAGYIFDSPSGYPVHITGWTRMGQTKDVNLQQLLMVGEPEAVVAVVNSTGLTAETGQCAWWCMPESENARRMLENAAIVDSELGPVLAEHLFEHLAFETEPREMIESVRLMLQPGLLSKEKQEKLWLSSQRNTANLVGFLQSSSEVILHERREHSDYEKMRSLFEEELSGDASNNQYAKNIIWFLSKEGQGYLETVKKVLDGAKTQAVMVFILSTLQDKFSIYFPPETQQVIKDINDIDQRVNALLDTSGDDFLATNEVWQSMIKILKDSKVNEDLIYSILWFSQLNPAPATAILIKTTAEGTLMRRKLKPVTDLIFKQFKLLLND